ncbi:MAG: LPP20 family lipoprotein [Spirochaetes bacterium]|nr:LPP20 family lipoprotein [Spirochaetota bacterium]
MSKFMRSKFFIIIITLSILIFNFLIYSCTSKDTNISKISSSKEPQWISQIPKDDNYYYFVGSGGPVLEESEGEKIALNDIQSKLFLLLGATVNTYLENNQIYKISENKEEFSNYLKSVVNVEGKGIISKFEIVDKYLKKTSDNKIIVYILARISKDAVIKEQKRLEKIYQEKLEYFLIPEQKANNYLKEGLYYEAIFESLKASQNAFLSDYENKLIVAERNLDRIIEISKKLKSNLYIPSSMLFLNEKQTEPFTYEVLFLDKGETKPVRNIPITFFYKDLNNVGDIITKEYKTTTNNFGKAYFSYSKIPFAGNSSIIAFLDIFDLIDNYIKIINENQVLREKANLIRNNFASLKESKNYNISSKTITLKTFFIFDFYDNSNNKIQSLNISNFLANLTKLGIKFSKSLNISIEKSDNIQNLLIFYKNDFIKNDIERVIVIRGETKSIKEYAGKQIASIDITSYIYIPKDDTLNYLYVNTTGNGDNIMLAILDGYQKGLEKLYNILLRFL